MCCDLVKLDLLVVTAHIDQAFRHHGPSPLQQPPLCLPCLSSPGVPEKVHSATPTRSLFLSHLELSEPLGCVGYCFVIFNSSIIIALNISFHRFTHFLLNVHCISVDVHPCL